MSIIVKLEEKKDFSATERKIADYILDNKEEILHLTIRELAQATYTGTSTVMRLIKKVYDGSFSDFKVDLAFEFHNLQRDDQYEQFQIEKQETAFSIINKIAYIQKSAIDYTKSLQNYQQIERVTKLINNATIIYVFTDGINHQIGQEFKYMMARIGKKVEVAKDDFWVALNCLKSGEQPLAIYINHREHNLALLDKIKRNHKVGIKSIAITGYINPTFETCCQEIISIPTGMSYSDLAPVTYTTAIHYILNIIVGCVIATNYSKTGQKLDDYTDLSSQ